VPVALTDSHCHLDQLEEVDAALEAAAAVGVARVVAVSQDAASMRTVLELATRYPGRVLAGLGVHPVTVTQRGAEAVATDLALLAERLPDAAVVGEAGLDHKWAVTDAQQDEQAQVLERQFELAARHRKPVNLHSRRCLRQVMEAAAAFHRDTDLHAQLHWFTQSKKLVRRCNDEGLFVSAGPTVLHDSQAAAAACEIADDLLLIETDAPVPIGGVEGHPRRARAVVEKLAALRGVGVEELARCVEANLTRFLG
jgi:TatD DNase family protein